MYLGLFLVVVIIREYNQTIFSSCPPTWRFPITFYTLKICASQHIKYNMSLYEFSLNRWYVIEWLNEVR